MSNTREEGRSGRPEHVSGEKPDVHTHTRCAAVAADAAAIEIS